MTHTEAMRQAAKDERRKLALALAEWERTAPRRCECGAKFLPSYGEYHRCPDCLNRQIAAAAHFYNVQ